ncbi:MAG TPA: hypothetical protein VLG69_00670 [Candidatus Andersenbacteria bacterium]|nr:hypothetical protein [Candidatus Andersenbacteria bacterium]
MVQTLTRVDVPEAQSVVEFDEVAFQAKEVLGYGLPKLQLTAENERISQQNALYAAMKELDIRPFDEKQVSQYKAKMARRHTPLSSKFSFAWQFVFGFGLSFGPPLVCALSGIARLCVGPGLFGEVFLASGIGTGALLIIVLSYIFRDKSKDSKEDEPETVPVAEWKLIPIQDYRGIVPEFVLQTAIDLKTRCPVAAFYIDELVESRRKLDPFLVVRCVGLQKHIEVWNEPEFKQKRVL